jgi:membrane protein implicated in regulation of membrane protease activity
MALLLILLGILLAGVVADFLIENDIATAATQPLTMAGTTLNLSTPVVAAIAFGLGALAVLLIVAGIRRFGRKRRRGLQDRIARLEEENARLATHRNLPNVIRVPDADQAVWTSDATPPPPAPTQPDAPATAEQPSSGGAGSTRW